MSHHCHARGCETPVRPQLLMCRRHWFQVPRDIQAAVYRHYRDGQCDDMQPSEAWHEAASAAIGFVAARETGGPLRGSEVKALRAYGYMTTVDGYGLLIVRKRPVALVKSRNRS